MTGAFNPGNSGGPLLHNNAVAGVVVSKRMFSLPLTMQSALRAMAKTEYDIVYSGTDRRTGKPIQLSQSQIVADLLNYYREVTQVFIGEAISASELIAFLDENKIPWTRARDPSPKPNKKR